MSKEQQPKPKPGRPKKKVVVTPEQYVHDMAAKQCTKVEIASSLGISIDTFDRRFAEIYLRGRQAGRARLRVELFNQALAGVPQILTFVAKNYLGMSDKQSLEVSGPDQGPIQISDVDSAITALLSRCDPRLAEVDSSGKVPPEMAPAGTSGTTNTSG